MNTKILSLNSIILFALMGAMSIAAYVESPREVTQSQGIAVQSDTPPNNGVTAHDGIYFSSEYVVDNFYYTEDTPENSAYYLIYTNPDQNMWAEAIRVDSTTYWEVVGAMETNNHIDGTLSATEMWEWYEHKLNREL